MQIHAALHHAAGGETMRRGPCLECDVHLAGGDKNGDKCMRCTKRIEYVAALEGRSSSMPVEMTDMARWTEEQVRYLRENFEGKTDVQLAEVIGKNAGAVAVKRLSMGLKKAAAWRSGWERLKERKAAAMAQAEDDLARCQEAPKHEDPPPNDPQMAEPPAPITSPAAELLPLGAGFTLINFKKHEAIYERLQTAAERDFRTPELQALFYISQALEREDGARDQRRPADFTR